MVEVTRIITCVDCGGRAHLASRFDDEYPEPFPGDIVFYRCEDCLDGWYLEVPEAAGDDEGDGRVR